MPSTGADRVREVLTAWQALAMFLDDTTVVRVT
jgi:hypothetical protein